MQQPAAAAAAAAAAEANSGRMDGSVRGCNGRIVLH